jgi:hypothetical protein
LFLLRVTEKRMLRPIAAEIDWERQREMWNRVKQGSSETETWSSR